VVTYTPLKVRRPRTDDTGFLSRVVGYRATCGCKWASPWRPTVKQARWDYEDHRREAHPLAEK